MCVADIQRPQGGSGWAGLRPQQAWLSPKGRGRGGGHPWQDGEVRRKLVAHT